MAKTNLMAKTRTELLTLARRLGLRGISTLKKVELVQTITQAQQKRSAPASRKLTVTTPASRKNATPVKRRAIRKRTVKPKGTSGTAKGSAKRTPRARRAPMRKVKIAPAAGAAEISAHKFDVAPTAKPPKQKFIEEDLGELPEAYGTGQLFLTARDPNWLYAYWDLSPSQMAHYRTQAADGRLLLRVLEKNHPIPVHESALQNDTRNWYIPVHKPAATFTAQLGFWKRDGSFHVICHSRETTTPSGVVSTDTGAQFATIPLDIPFDELVQIVRDHVRDGESLAETLYRLYAEGFRLPFRAAVEFGPWSAEQTAALERLVGGEMLHRLQMGSFEINEWLRQRLQEQLGSALFSAFSPAGASWQAVPQKGFWFAVNAELIIYGATEPDAGVTVDGNPIQLRADGTFSFHYVFPDGQYQLPVVAVSAAGDDKRAVKLTFERRTETVGTVGKITQPAQFKPPA